MTKLQFSIFRVLLMLGIVAASFSGTVSHADPACATVPPFCSNGYQDCKNTATSLETNSLYGVPNTGNVQDYHFPGWQANYSSGASPEYFYTAGDTLGPANSQGIAFSSELDVTCGFTMLGFFYLTPGGTPATNTLFAFSSQETGPVMTLNFNGYNFSLTSVLNDRANTRTFGNVYAQTFWDPLSYNMWWNGSGYSTAFAPTGWYMVALTIGPDQKATLDVISYDATRPRNFYWSRSMLDAGWPSTYVQASSGTVKIPLGSTGAIGWSIGRPSDHFDLVGPGSLPTPFDVEGFPAGINTYVPMYRTIIFKAPLTRDQVLSEWGSWSNGASFNPGNTQLVQDGDLQGYHSSAGQNPQQLYPCNSGSFLKKAPWNGLNYINTPCQDDKPLVYPPS